MVQLRTATIEFSALAGNTYYIPLGFTVDDILRLHIAKAPPDLKESKLHSRMMAGEVLALKAALIRQNERIEKQQSRLEAAELQVHEHQAHWDNWSEDQNLDRAA